MSGPMDIQSTGSPDQRAVLDFHRHDDVDSRPEAHHHTLGKTRNQGSEGSHNHDGTTSVAPLQGVTFTGSRTTNAADILNQLCNALTALGAANNTGA